MKGTDKKIHSMQDIGCHSWFLLTKNVKKVTKSAWHLFFFIHLLLLLFPVYVHLDVDRRKTSFNLNITDLWQQQQQQTFVFVIRLDYKRLKILIPCFSLILHFKGEVSLYTGLYRNPNCIPMHYSATGFVVACFEEFGCMFFYTYACYSCGVCCVYADFVKAVHRSWSSFLLRNHSTNVDFFNCCCYHQHLHHYHHH